MRGLDQVLSELMLDISSDSRFNSRQNFGRIEKSAKKLSELAHDLSGKKMKKPEAGAPEAGTAEADPSVTMLSLLFSGEADRAYRELKRGHRPYARSILRGITGYCIACHTRNASGPSFAGIQKAPGFDSLSATEKAEALAASRQFDAALDAFEAIVADPIAAETRMLDWEKSVRYALAISVRVKKDPDRTARLVERVITTPKAPLFLKQDALQWKASIEQWKTELGRQPRTEEGLHAEAVRLIADARTFQKYPADRAGDILYLRASAAIHDLLQSYPNGRYSDEAFFLAGVAYEALRDLNLGELHEIYYEGCIHKSPHTAIALSCYQRLEKSIYLGYSGSGGVNLPDDVRSRLTELEKLAAPAGGDSANPRVE